MKFEDSDRNPKPQEVVHADDTTKKRKRRQKYEADEPIAEVTNAGNSVITHETTPAKTPVTTATTTANIQNNAPIGVMPTVAVGADSGDSGNSSRLMGLQHSAAQVIRNIMPDETPDRNAGVSATRFGMEVAASAVGIAIDPKKKKPKLKHDKSRLKFGESETKENGGQTENAESERSSSDGEQPDNVKSEPSNGEVSGDSVSDKPPDIQGGAEQKAENNNPTAADSSPTDKPPPTDSTQNSTTNSTKDSTTQPPPKPPTSTDASTSPSPSPATSSDKPDGKLQFSNEEKQISKLEKKADKYSVKLEKARDKLPSKIVEKPQLVFDEDKKKNVSKLTHDKEVIPIGEAKWNKPKEQSRVSKVGGVVTSMAVTKIHAKIHQVEHENVGVKVAHKAELMGESAYRGAKKSVRSAYRFHKNRPYRRVAKLEQKAIKNKIKLDYKKALRDNPKLKSNILSRFMQKRAIKRNYAKDLRAAKNAAQTGKKAVGITAKAAKLVTALVRRNPVLLIKIAIIGLLFFLIMSLFTMCAAIFSGGNAFIGAVTYPAEPEDICDASVLMTELETELRIYIDEIEENHPDIDEFIFELDSIGHCPFQLIAFLSAMYHDFTFAEVEATIREIFDEMYTLELEEEVETRTGTGTGTCPETGESYEYEYEYDWYIFTVTLTAKSFMEVIESRMNEEQTHHFHILMYSHGARQFIGNPFDFNWMPFVTSLFGYRIHPINGGKQFHWGIDIGLPTGTEILATFDGVVTYVAYHPTGYGRIVIIENEDGVQARFAHCHEIFVTVGQEVERGDVIATVGNTGASTGAHLHLEVAWEGRRFNPILFVEFRN